MLMSNLNKIKLLSMQDRRLLFQSILLLPLIHLALLLLGYARLRAVMERLAPLRSPEETLSEIASIKRAREIARMVSIAAVHGLYKATCLRKSLLVWWFLRREGLPGQLCFGVRMFHSKLEAHAWVEYNGIVINDSANIHEQYQALQDVLPSIRLGS